MRTAPGTSRGTTFGGGRGKGAGGLALTALAAGAMLYAWRATDDGRSEGVVRIEPATAVRSGPAPVPLPPVGAAMVYELHGTSPGGARPSALLAPHGAAPRSFAVGEAVGPGVVLDAVARGHVLLREGAAIVRIDLPPRLGGSGEAVAPADRGLQPEPRPPTGELSAAQMAALRQLNGTSPPPPSPSPLPGDEAMTPTNQ